MPVQIPTINRFAPQAPESAGRMNVDLPNTAAVANKIGEATMGVAETALKLHEKAADDARDLTSTEAAYKFDARVKSELAKIKQLEGDPTAAYSSFDQQVPKWREEIMGEYEGVDGATKQAISQKMDHRYWLVQDDRNVSEALQRSAHAKKLLGAAVDTQKEQMFSLAQTFDPKDPQSIAKIESALDEIYRLHITQGKQDWTALPKADGSYEVTEILQKRIDKDRSDALKNMIRVLTESGQQEKAQAMMDRYGDQLLSDDKLSLLKTKRESTIKKNALVELSKIRGIEDPEKAWEKLNAIPDLEVQEYAKKAWNTERIIVQGMKKAARDTAFDKLGDLAQSGQFKTFFQLEQSPAYRDIINNNRLMPGDVKKIEKLFNRSSESEPAALDDVHKAFEDGDFVGMDSKRFRELTLDLGAKDFVFYQAKWRSANEVTDNEKAKFQVAAAKRFDELASTGENPLYKKNKKNAYSSKTDRETGTRLRNEFYQFMETEPIKPGESPSSRAERFFTMKKQGVAFAPPAARGTPSPLSTPTPRGSPAPSMADRPSKDIDLKKDGDMWKKKFQEVNKEPWDLNKHGPLRNFIDQYLKAQEGK